MEQNSMVTSVYRELTKLEIMSLRHRHCSWCNL